MQDGAAAAAAKPAAAHTFGKQSAARGTIYQAVYLSQDYQRPKPARAMISLAGQRGATARDPADRNAGFR